MVRKTLAKNVANLTINKSNKAILNKKDQLKKQNPKLVIKIQYEIQAFLWRLINLNSGN